MKLKRVLLVDDDIDCNFFHERLLKKMKCVEEIHIANDGKEAMDFLLSVIDGVPPAPAIIFLDINMPRMNGWEFLASYVGLDEARKAKSVLIMLTTSLNPEEKERCLQYRDVKGFFNKYLDREGLQKILEENFPECF